MYVRVDKQGYPGLNEELSRKCGPHAGAEHRDRRACQEGRRNAGTHKGSRLPGCNERYGDQYPELWFVGKTSDEGTRKHGPALKEQ